MNRVPALPAILILSLAATLSLSAAAPDPNEARLREALRSALAQLSTAETERSALEAGRAEMEQKARELTQQVGALAKQAAADRAAAAKATAALQALVDEQKDENVRLKGGLEKQAALAAKYAETLKATEARRAALESDLVILQRRFTDCAARNRALGKIGNEILTRYEKFSLGEALAAKEPFVGSTRTRLENLVQDYQDKLDDQRFKP